MTTFLPHSSCYLELKTPIAAVRRSEVLQSIKSAPHESPLPDILVADALNEPSIVQMVKSTKVLINAVGPFRFYGEVVVKNCAEFGTDYVDITGEPEFAESMFLKYDDLAGKHGATIVSCCGFDSIPAELGTLFVKKLFWEEGGECTQVELVHCMEYDEKFGISANL